MGYKVQDAYKHKDKWYKEVYSDKYLLGKWSDVKATFKELIERARHRYIALTSAGLKQSIKTSTRQLEDLEETANAMFYSGTTSTGDLPF